jgi:hypothetical protein
MTSVDLIAESAALLRLPPEHFKVRQLASTRLTHERLLAKLAAGDVTVLSDITTVAESIERMAPPMPPTRVELGIPSNEPCRKCGYQEPPMTVNPGGKIAIAEGMRQRRIAAEPIGASPVNEPKTDIAQQPPQEPVSTPVLDAYGNALGPEQIAERQARAAQIAAEEDRQRAYANAAKPPVNGANASVVWFGSGKAPDPYR